MANWPNPFINTGQLVAGETISGLRSVCLLSSGILGLANDTSGSARLPAVGINTSNALSGQNVTFLMSDYYSRIVNYQLYDSILDAWSGYANRLLYVGSGGSVVYADAVSSGGSWQKVGNTISGGLLLEMESPDFLDYYHPVQGVVLSGNVGSGQIASGHMASGFIASLGSVALTSGQVSSGFLGDASVLSGSIGSGQVASGHMASGFVAALGAVALTSGQVTSGFLGDASVVSGSYASGSIAFNHFASGAITSGWVIGSGSRWGRLGNQFHVASGTLGSFDLGSGIVTNLYLGSGSVTSGAYASGSVSAFKLASGLLTSGVYIGSGTIGGQLGGTPFHISSGTIDSLNLGSGVITNLYLGSGAVQSGVYASGSISKFKLASGILTSGVYVGSGTIVGQAAAGVFNIASGSIGSFDLGSGIITNLYLGSGAVQSGVYASGSISHFKLASNTVTSGQIGSGTLLAGLTFVMDGGGAAITTGAKGYVEVPFDCVLESATLYGDRSGQMFFGIWKDTYANWPPISGDTIATSGAPILSGQTAKMMYSGGNISGWTQSFTKGDVLSFQVLSNASGMQQASISLALGRT